MRGDILSNSACCISRRKLLGSNLGAASDVSFGDYPQGFGMSHLTTFDIGDESKYVILSVQTCVLTNPTLMMIFIGCRASGQTSAFTVLHFPGLGKLQ
jgi:hypothetical protein